VNSPNVESDTAEVEAAARSLGLQVNVLSVSKEDDFDRVFATLIGNRASALLLQADAFFLSRSNELVALAARHAIPAIYFSNEFAAAGGLISYGTSQTDVNRQAGVYTGRILAGAKPADLPVTLPTRFDLVVNLKTAKALGLTIPLSLLGRADEVIE
jgi:putative ABC transport system substrate-binding protein